MDPMPEMEKEMQEIRQLAIKQKQPVIRQPVMDGKMQEIRQEQPLMAGKLVWEEMNKQLEVMNKQLEEMNKKLQERDRQLDKKLEDINKKLEERDRQPAEICNKDPVTYIVSGTSRASEYRSDCMGEYYPTGKFVNGFPIFRKGENYLYVGTYGVWIIGSEFGKSRGKIYRPNKNPTPSIPPRNGWKVGMGGVSWVQDTTLTVHPRRFITYRVSNSESNPQLTSILGNYHPTEEILNGFPIFRKAVKGKDSLYVGPEKRWIIIGSGGYVYQPDNNPTPSTPPLVGWCLPGNMHKSLTSVTVIPVIGRYP